MANSKVSADDLWLQCKNDYRQKKGDPHADSDGLNVITDLLSEGFDPKRIRAAYNYFISDTQAGDKWGYKMDRFASSSTMYFERVRSGDGSRPKEKWTGEKASMTYLCSNWECKRPQELILDRRQCDGDFPEVLADGCGVCGKRMIRLDVHPNPLIVRLGLSPGELQRRTEQ